MELTFVFSFREQDDSVQYRGTGSAIYLSAIGSWKYTVHQISSVTVFDI